MARDRRLIDKGRGEPFQGLLDQGRYQQKLAETHADRLESEGWSGAQTAELKSAIAALDDEKARQIDERSGAHATTLGEGAAITGAKKIINRMRNVLPQVLRANPDAGVSAADFNAGGRLARKAPTISEFLGKIRVHAAKLDAGFAKFFKGAKLSELIDAAKARLDGASTDQDTDLSALPDDTAAVYERKGHILELIEDLNGVARNAFEDEPELRNQFNKDILNRARVPRPKPKTQPA
ncbi:MAG: hypothetical protein U1F43_05240 [Myxococcota bacterium]